MMKIKTIFLSYLLTLSINVQSQVFENIRLEDSLDQVKAKITDLSDSIKLVRIDPHVFPLAKSNEVHLIAFNVRLKSGSVDKMVLTFSDNKLTYIECNGNIQQALLKSREDEPQNYLIYQVYLKDLLFIDSNQDAAWFLTQESVHPNLFTWNNPLLGNKELGYEPSAKLPDFISMGGVIWRVLNLYLKAKARYSNETLWMDRILMPKFN